MSVAVVACTSYDYERVIGTLASESGVPHPVQYAPGRVGEPVEILVTTQSDLCVVGPEDTELERLNDRWVITPIDLKNVTPGIKCSAALFLFHHVIDVVFEEAGTQIFHVHALNRENELVDYPYVIAIE